jgi:hypothetical protein
VASLLLRLVHGESADGPLYGIVRDFLGALPGLSEEAQDAAEILAALEILHALGLDAGERPPAGFSPAALAYVAAARPALIARVNRGIAASGL